MIFFILLYILTGLIGVPLLAMLFNSSDTLEDWKDAYFTGGDIGIFWITNGILWPWLVVYFYRELVIHEDSNRA